MTGAGCSHTRWAVHKWTDWDAVADHMAWMSVNEKAFLGAVMPFLSGPPVIKHYQ